MSLDTLKYLQPSYNIGLVGHVSAGKSSCIRALTGVETYKHSKEKERGITMKLGYANCKIFKCPVCPEPQCFSSNNDQIKNQQCVHCQSDTELVQYFSFVDCPGHESLMSTMISGATVMDYAILLIDGSQKCPQPQTIEHMAVLEILKVNKIIIIQNKLDLIDVDHAQEQYLEIKEFIKGTCAENAPIIPLSAQKKYNIDVLCEYIIKYFGEVIRPSKRPRMNIIRSFDINKPGTEISSVRGGVLGGSLLAGELKVGDIVEVKPGLISKDEDGNITWKSLMTKITSIQSDSHQLETAKPGGLIGICTNFDPVLTRSDRMVGHVLGLVDQLPDTYITIKAKCLFMKRADSSKQNKPNRGDIVLLNISSRPILANILEIKNKRYHFELKSPCCMDIGDVFSISFKNQGSWRLIGMGCFEGN